VQRGWHPAELEQLVRLYSAQAAAGRVSGWDIDSTELEDPQFYLFGAGSDEDDCVICVSRVGCRYVLEDGNGTLLAEDVNLAPVVMKASRALAGQCRAVFVTRLLVTLCAIRVLIEERLEPLLPDSSDMLLRVAPQLSAIL
jgi:hypothetical protein